MSDETAVIVAARDEEQVLGATLGALRAALPAARLWVADDGSRDRTATVAADFGATVVGGPGRAGKGQAMSAAADAALRRVPANAVVLLCDADLGASAISLRELVAVVRAGDAEMALARFARPRGGGFGVALWFARWALARRGGAGSGTSAGAPISGQRALRAAQLGELLPFAGGFGMELGIGIHAARASWRVVEVELDLRHRTHGRTPAGFAHRARQLIDFARVYSRHGEPAEH